MPTYDYRCDDCGDEFEVWQSIKDDPLTDCPRCGGPIRKVMSPAGIVLYSTFLGGSGDDAGNAIAVDANGNAYVGGITTSLNFPVFPANLPLGNAFQTRLLGGTDGFVAKLDPGGATLAYSTYLGSNTDDAVLGLALDAAGNALVTGFTGSPNFPNNGALPCRGVKRTGADAFVDAYVPLLTGVAEGYLREGKRFMRVAIGCTGGKHRSVAMTEEIARRLGEQGYVARAIHRDLGRE